MLVPTTDPGYYDFVRKQKGAIISALLKLSLIIAATASLSACDAAYASIAFVDPILAGAVPEAKAWYAAAARTVIVLPETGTAAALYAGIEAHNPQAIVLSPLLGSEISAILERDDHTAVVYAGSTSPEPHPRLFSATFSIDEAARMAGAMLARSGHSMGGGLVCAVFAGYPPRIAAQASEAFTLSYGEAESAAAVRLITLTEPFSQMVAEQLRSLDIRAAYVSAPEDETERWIAQAFDRSTLVVTARAVPLRPTLSMAAVQLVWDMEATLRLVEQRLEAGKSGDSPGIWQVLPSNAMR